MTKKTSFFLFLGSLALMLVLTGCLGEKTTNTNTTTAAPAAAPTTTVEVKTALKLDATSYQAGDDVTVKYDIVEDLGSGPWVGIVPAATAHGSEENGDAVDVDYEYITSKKGTVTLTAPSETGKYDVRAYDTDQADGLELGYVSFTVTE